MTKAKARQRAKAKAGEKAKKRMAQADTPAKDIPPGRFDPGTRLDQKPAPAPPSETSAVHGEAHLGRGRN